MALQNIGAANSGDAFYRYKMPKMVTKIEGRGNGIKTNIVNMVDIAKALERPASYTTKYFGYELGAQSKFDHKTGVSLVNGAHETSKLAGILENFIKCYVQCYECKNPETEILISNKTGCISLKCAACGFISDVDMRDKLAGFIVKNPPELKKSGKDKKAMRRAEKERLKEGEMIDEEMKKLKKDGKKKGEKSSKTNNGKKKKNGSDEEKCSSGSGDADVASEDEEEDSVQWQTDTSAEAAKKRMKEQLSAVTAEMVILSTEEPKPKVVKPKKKDETALLTSEIKNKLKEGIKPSELKTYLTSQTGGIQLVINALFNALFEGVGKGFANEVAKKRAYLMTVVNDEESQMGFLRAIEGFSEACNNEALKEVGLGVKVLYDADVLDEEIIIKWFDEGAEKEGKVWKNVKAFVEWLKSAESESEEE
ncbi:hypothetical protein LUZ60_000153 [Juncus effusus]|nr:hypothetical protein LUZ60_000153 [Juncus effusus]